MTIQDKHDLKITAVLNGLVLAAEGRPLEIESPINVPVYR